MRLPVFALLLLPLFSQAMTGMPWLGALQTISKPIETGVAPNRSIPLGPWGALFFIEPPAAVAVAKAPAIQPFVQTSIVAQLLSVNAEDIGGDNGAATAIALAVGSSRSAPSALDVRKRR